MKFKSFLKLLEDGESAGKLEIAKTDLKTAREYAEKLFQDNGYSLDKEIPNFDENYLSVQKKAKMGKTLRKDMPVIDEKDVKDLQTRLKGGYIDINKPFSKDTNPKDPFPTGMSKEEAKKFLTDGLKVNDKASSDNDDKVLAKFEEIPLGEIKPVQKQIYFDKSIGATAEFGVKGTEDFLSNKTTFVVSNDNYIIDGHHRWLSGNLVDPKLKVHCLKIGLPMKKLLPLALSYSDAVGNKRNA